MKTFGKDYAYTQFTFGEGVGRYRGGVTAVPDANGELQRRRARRVHGRLRALLDPRLSSNAVYSVASTPDEDYYAATFNKHLDYGAINLIYWFFCRTAPGPASSICTAAARSSAADAAPPIGFSSRFASTFRPK